MTVQNADVANILNTLPTFSDRKCQSISIRATEMLQELFRLLPCGRDGEEHIDLTEFS